MVGWLRVGIALTVIAIASVLLTPLQWLALKTGVFDGAILPRLWHRIAVRALGLRVHVEGEIARQRPLLIAANHISWTDIMVLGSLAGIVFIAKSEVAGWPILGTFARMQRTIFVERAHRGGSARQADEVAGRLAGEDIVALFAEGTTGDGSHLQPFKSTLFGSAQIAIGKQGLGSVFIQPVAIAYTRLHGMPMGRLHRTVASWMGSQDLLPHLIALLRERAMDVEVAFGEVIEFTAQSDRKAIARQVEGAVRAMLEDALGNRQRAGRARR